MKRQFFLASLFAVVTAAAAAQAPEHLGSRIYPLTKGNRWVYRATDSRAAQSKKVTFEVDREEVYSRTEKKEKQEVKESYVGFLVKAISDGKTSVDHVVVTKDGILRVSTAGTPANPPIMFVNFKSGVWDCNSMTGNTPIKGTFKTGSGPVQVPAGSFPKATLVSYREANSPIEIDSWFVEDVGMVKQRVKTKNTEVTLELEQFKVAK